MGFNSGFKGLNRKEWCLGSGRRRQLSQDRKDKKKRNNEELNRAINGEDMKFVKSQRIRWLGHVKRMEVGVMPRKIMEGRLFIGREERKTSSEMDG